jgi:hypothetical protein
MSGISKLVKIGAGMLAASAPRQAWNLLTAGAVERVVIQGDQTTIPGMVGRYLEKVATVLWRPNPPISLSREYDRRTSRWSSVPVELLMEVSTLYLYRWRPILGGYFSRQDQETKFHSSGYAMSFARGTVDVDRLIVEAMADSESSRATSRFGITSLEGGGFVPSAPGQAAPASITVQIDLAPVRYIGADKKHFGPPRQPRAAEWMWWSPEMQLLREDARRWLEREQWCAERGISSRRGWMIYGPPGNGKTLLVYAIAEELDLPIYALDLSAMTSRDFVSAWRQASSNVPAIVLVEDFDSTIVKRENIRSKEHGVAFETILNCIAGVRRAGGILFVMTTNDPKAVDPALCSMEKEKPDEESRPGRIDIRAEIGNPPREGRLAVALRVLQDLEAAERVADHTEGRSIAQVQEICYRMAVEK